MGRPQKKEKEKQEEDYREEFMDKEYLIEKTKVVQGALGVGVARGRQEDSRGCDDHREADGSRAGQSFYSSKASWQ